MTVSEFTQSGDNQHKTMRRSQHLLYVLCVRVCVCVCVCVYKTMRGYVAQSEHVVPQKQ